MRTLLWLCNLEAAETGCKGNLPFGGCDSAIVTHTVSQLEYKHVFSMNYILNYVTECLSFREPLQQSTTNWVA